MKSVELIVATCGPRDQADDVLAHLIELNRSSVIELVSAMVLARDENGQVSAQTALDQLKTEGPVVAALAGSPLGLFAGIAELVAGAKGAARPGQVGDVALPGQNLEKLAEDLAPGTSAILALVEEEEVDAVVRELQPLASSVRRFVLEAKVPAATSDGG